MFVLLHSRREARMLLSLCVGVTCSILCALGMYALDAQWMQWELFLNYINTWNKPIIIGEQFTVVLSNILLDMQLSTSPSSKTFSRGKSAGPHSTSLPSKWIFLKASFPIPHCAAVFWLMPSPNIIGSDWKLKFCSFIAKVERFQWCSGGWWTCKIQRLGPQKNIWYMNDMTICWITTCQLWNILYQWRWTVFFYVPGIDRMTQERLRAQS